MKLEQGIISHFLVERLDKALYRRYSPLLYDILDLLLYVTYFLKNCVIFERVKTLNHA
jgi:hypothetical protein